MRYANAEVRRGAIRIEARAMRTRLRAPQVVHARNARDAALMHYMRCGRPCDRLHTDRRRVRTGLHRSTSMAHKVIFNLPRRELGREDIEFVVE